MQENKKICYAAGCHRPLPKGKRKYCSDKCSNRINMQKKRARKAGVEWSQEEDTLNIPSQKTNVASRRGQVYEDIKESGLALDLYEKKINLTEVAKILNTTAAAVSMAYQAYLEDLRQEEEQKNWSLPKVAKLLYKILESSEQDILEQSKAKNLRHLSFIRNGLNQ